MRVFVTGATGFIGEAVVRELLNCGHQVLGLARSDKAVDLLGELGAQAHRGDLSDIDSLTEGARSSDGVIHTAFINDFSRYQEVAAIDKRAVEALAGGLEGSDKALVATSVTVLLTPGRVGTEADALMPDNPLGVRAASEATVLAAGERGVRASVVRLPPSVHGLGDYGFLPAMIEIARLKRFSAYVEGGTNRWPAIHRLDAARLYRLALEKASPGLVSHAVAEEGITLRVIADAIGEGLALPVRSIAEVEAAAHFGLLANFVSLDNPTSSSLTREKLGWSPEGNSLLKDLRESNYFPLSS